LNPAFARRGAQALAPLSVRVDAGTGAPATPLRAPYTLVLRLSGARWLISDVSDSHGSLRAQLIRHNACMRAHHTDAAITRCFGEG
jgi:hypothetical protein